MIDCYRIADVRAAEGAAMAELPEGELMARAAHGLAVVTVARLPAPGRVVALVGSGGNGGDALYAAAELADFANPEAPRRPRFELGLMPDDDDVDADEEVAAEAADALGAAPESVTAVLVAPSVHEKALKAARKAGVVVIDATDDQQVAEATVAVAESDLVLDGIAGLGGKTGFRSDVYRHHLKALLDSVPPDAYVIAVDLPSGSDPAGEVPDTLTVWADETVTFGVPKPVHVLATAPACGILTVVDIGLDMTPYRPVAQGLDHDDIAQLWPVPDRTDDKYTRGVLGVIAGGETYPGAAVLATTAAVTCGAGMVRYVGTPTPAALVRQAVPEAVHGVGRVQAWVIGPGLDVSAAGEDAADAQLDAARAALASDLPCLVDAGGLDLLDGRRANAGARTLITPHAGELARLLSRLDEDCTAHDVRSFPVYFARKAADLLHATVLLKGATTYVVPPPASGLPVRASSDAPAWAGTAGSGDVLAGVAGTLLAAGLDPLDAGSVASVVHGLAAHEANPDGPVRASDIAHALGRTVARVLRRSAS